ncbi:MAG: methyltransferase [Actinobacteria bacterium]|nr:methyltransferase [Actinomycetota bacterium]
MSHYFETPRGRADTFRVTVRLWDTEVELESSRGVFSGGGLDTGTAVLLRSTAPPPGPVRLLDLGCGIGPITVALGLANHEARITAVDVNERALALTRANADRLGIGDRVRTALPADVADDERYDEIWSNPPIRIGKAALHHLLVLWLGRLLPDGTARLVVARNLGADSLATWLEGEGWACRRTASANGFRVFAVARPDVSPDSDN